MDFHRLILPRAICTSFDFDFALRLNSKDQGSLKLIDENEDTFTYAVEGMSVRCGDLVTFEVRNKTSEARSFVASMGGVVRAWRSMKPPRIFALAALQAELVYLDERRVVIDELLEAASGPDATAHDLALARERARDPDHEPFTPDKHVPEAPALALGQMWQRGLLVKTSSSGAMQWVRGLTAKIINLHAIAAPPERARWERLVQIQYIESGAQRWRPVAEFEKGGAWRYVAPEESR
jgi:hypothetical protein